ncbi:tyrosine-protein phosphatase [Mariniplasma anaerobium]|uniref:protein-tyrosine-phosphatase n=1 Tax=Mariniplasma anaerobium TaxID=2735436 RepID=A0A7U9XUV4_9MOLU|nr:CpsB/CapC family capsule biosynthesis tyrosine phosphatase [Mariniplasma anaerobium]BCR36292.1 tyrosine protein phosphatase [Mariniplasma anaerobium]
MIDIHTHLLFDVDDGCKKIEDSLEMIEKAIEVGITDLFVTPHYSFRRKFTVTYDVIEERFLLLKEAVAQKGLKVNLYLGSEIDETSDLNNFLENNMCHKLDNSKYVLIDFGTREAVIDDICYELIVEGYIPIIAHPERYSYIKDFNTFKQWKETGALIQINASSLFASKQIKKQVKKLIKNNLVDFVSSDSHRNSSTFEYFKQAYQYIEKKQGIEKAKMIFISNPKKIILGEE